MDGSHNREMVGVYSAVMERVRQFGKVAMANAFPRFHIL
jgi:hypothetical protein